MGRGYNASWLQAAANNVEAAQRHDAFPRGVYRRNRGTRSRPKLVCAKVLITWEIARQLDGLLNKSGNPAQLGLTKNEEEGTLEGGR